MTNPGPDLPANWYLIGPASQIRRGTIAAHDIGPHSIVVWRGREAGTLTAFAAHCAHMGCHLGQGRVIGDALRCGLHHRLIAQNGSFGAAMTDGPGQPVFALQEYVGGAWVRLGPSDAIADLPELGLAEYPACYAGEHRFPLPWQALVANGFDCEHLASVHERALLEPPTLTRTRPAVIELHYRTRPIGRGVADRLTSLLARDGVRGHITAINGSMMLVRGQLGERKSFILMSFVPDRTGHTTVRAIVGVEQPGSAWGRLQARIAARLFKAFLYKDLRVLDRLNWHEPAHADTLGDRFTRQMCDYFRQLPDG